MQDDYGDQNYSHLNEFIFNPYFVYLSKSGEVTSIQDTSGYFIPRRFMQAIKDYATQFLSAHQSDDEIAEENKQRQFRMDEVEKARQADSDREVSVIRAKGNEKHIYLIRDTIRGFYKIGSAKNVDTRFKQLKTANPGIEIVCSYFSKVSDEKELHEILENVRVSGEWFSFSKQDWDTFHQYFAQKGVAPTIYT